MPHQREARVESRLERWVMPFVRDPTLWPILVVVIGHVVAFVAPAMLLAVRDGRIGSWAVLLGLAALTVELLRAEPHPPRRPGPLGVVTLVTWLLSAGAAAAADHYGIF
jgi:hypothetical protein